MVTVEPLQFDSPDTTALTFEDKPDGLGLNANEGVPEQDADMVVVGAVVVKEVVVIVVLELETFETVSIASVLLLPFTQA